MALETMALYRQLLEDEKAAEEANAAASASVAPKDVDTDKDKDKYKDLSFTITTMNEKEGLVDYRNGLDEQVITIFTKK